mgnify:CR=1 FL=1
MVLDALPRRTLFVGAIQDLNYPYYPTQLRFMIKRHIPEELGLLIQEYPTVTLLGPRQAGKTTLAKATRPK